MEVSETVLGSVSHKLVQHAGRPVLVAHGAGASRRRRQGVGMGAVR